MAILEISTWAVHFIPIAFTYQKRAGDFVMPAIMDRSELLIIPGGTLTREQLPAALREIL